MLEEYNYNDLGECRSNDIIINLIDRVQKLTQDNTKYITALKDIKNVTTDPWAYEIAQRILKNEVR